MMIIPPGLARAIAEERQAKAARIRTMVEARRRHRMEKMRARTPAPTPEADVIEIAFGAQCETDSIGA